MKHPLFVRFIFPLLASFCSAALAEPLAAEVPATAATKQPSAVATPAEVAQPTIKLAFILPQKKSRFDAVSQYALDGALAANYASKNPAEVLLVRPGSDGSVATQLRTAAAAGALAAIGPIDRDAIEQIAQMEYLPLPVITLNQIDLDKVVPLTEEEIAQQRVENEARRMADDAARELNEVTEAQQKTDALTEQSKSIDGLSETSLGGSIATKVNVPGLILAKDLPQELVRFEPRIFPRGLLMSSLSLEADAAYIAELGVEALPRLTEAGNRPKVLVLDQDKPLQKRVSAAFTKALTQLGYVPDRMTIDLKNLDRITQFFELVVEDDDPEIEPEEPIDQEVDPLAWRQQQMRLMRESAERRAHAAFAEPPYYAVFMALDATTASQIRPRLPIRTRIWGTSLLYPGNPETDSTAKALTFDLKHVGFVDAPFILEFDEETFDKTYKVAPPANLVGKQLFALGADALHIANSIARGEYSGEFKGLTGDVRFDLDSSPVVTRHGVCAMISNGAVRTLSAQELIDFHELQPGTQFSAKKSPSKKTSTEKTPDPTTKAAQ